MAKNLIIVESPAKAKTIENYLGKGYEVLASIGHIVDLPEKKLGVDVENNFAPTYQVIEGKQKVVNILKKAASTADKVFLASDPDREGEAIAWHIQEQIKDKNNNIVRVQFNEITKQGIKDAIERPGEVNMSRVDAQQSRRILDRLVGYQVSPLLWKPLRYGLSAGRVQSVALRLVCEREDEIEKFVSKEWWSLDANLEVFENSQLKGLLKASLDKKNGKKFELKNEADTDKVISELKKEQFAISDIEKKNIKGSAPLPFITARLQQEAIRKFGMTARTVMSTAQQLYEGVDMGADGRHGLITYMRTDSTRVAPEAQQEAAKYIGSAYGSDYLGKQKTAKKGKSVQDAHEAIRPTVITNTPEKIKAFLSPAQYKLYKLIWERFIASQMADAQYEQTTVIINAGAYGFRASGRAVKFAGYTALYTETADEDAKAEDNQLLLNVDKSSMLKARDFDKKQHFTQPPPRFTEASLVRSLEQQGIGRPSTYASIISTIVDREYVEIKEKRIFPTELGRIVIRLLVQNFPNIFDVKFTADMEEGLDKVEEGQESMQELLDSFYKSFSDELKAAAKKFNTDLKLDMPCPECGKDLTVKYGKNGSFIACSGYPECSFTTDFERDEEGKIRFIERKDSEQTGIICDKCGAEMLIKTGRYGEMLACSAYPACKNIKNFMRLPDGSIRVLTAGEKLGEKCPTCSVGDVVLKSGKNGLFAACSRYPDCRFTAGIELNSEGKLKVIKHKEAENIDYGNCEKCGKPFVVKKSFRGPFLACSGYPDCKNTKSMKSFANMAKADNFTSKDAVGETKSSDVKSAETKKQIKTVKKEKNPAKTKSAKKTSDKGETKKNVSRGDKNK